MQVIVVESKMTDMFNELAHSRLRNTTTAENLYCVSGSLLGRGSSIALQECDLTIMKVGKEWVGNKVF
jgi:hypothetical protein